jgi:ribosomal protein S18 acetylase RimI-like enzyme
MDAVPTDLSATSLSAAILDNLFGWIQYLGRSAHAELRAGPPFWWVLTDLPVAFLNNVMQTRLAPETADGAIADALAYFRSAGVGELSWWVEPGAQPGDLGDRLAAHGLSYHEGASGMALALDALQEDATPRELVIEAVADRAGLDRWIEAFCLGYQMREELHERTARLFRSLPPSVTWRYYLGSREGQPVAVSQLFQGAGVAGIYSVATVPEARRRGYGAAVTLAALRDARALGYRAAVLEASSMGFPVYERMGFRTLRQMSSYLWRVETTA